MGHLVELLPEYKSFSPELEPSLLHLIVFLNFVKFYFSLPISQLFLF